MAILTFLILVIQLSVKKFAIAQLPWSNKYIQDFVHYFIIAITVLVVAVPEGLPLAVTISLAYAVRVRSVILITSANKAELCDRSVRHAVRDSVILNERSNGRRPNLAGIGNGLIL